MNGGGGLNFDGLVPRQVNPEPKRVTKDSSLLAWKAFNFERDKLDYRLIILLSVLLIALVGYSVWQKDWFAIGVFSVVAAVTFWYRRAVRPKETEYKITPMGIYEEERFYSFSEIHSFWLVYNQKIQKLFLAFDKKYLPTLNINIKGIDAVLLRSLLLKKIPEQTKRSEGLVDRLIRVLGL